MEYFTFPKEKYNFVGTTITITEFMTQVAEASVAWESGVRLARYLESNQARYPLAGSSVLELGAGTGLVSIVCSLLGAHVTATDVKEVLGSLSVNITNNTRRDKRPSICELRWGHDLSAFDPRAYRYVMASDLVYREAFLGPLALTLGHFLAGGAIVLFSLKTRFAFCGEFLRWLSKEHRVRTLAEWPEDRMLLWEITARENGGVESGRHHGGEWPRLTGRLKIRDQGLGSVNGSTGAEAGGGERAAAEDAIEMGEVEEEVEEEEKVQLVVEDNEEVVDRLSESEIKEVVGGGGGTAEGFEGLSQARVEGVEEEVVDRKAADM